MNEKKQITNPVKVIRRYCLECCLESPKEVELCPAEGCWLHPFRMGTNPYRTRTTREYTEEEREAARQRLKRVNENRKTKLAEIHD